MTLFTELTTDVGRARELNEDSARIVPLGPASTLLIVCDGMGGHEGGEVASATAVDAIASSLAVADATAPREALCAALVDAHNAVRRVAEARAMPTMGTTAVVAWVLGSKVWVAWVGDSRFYRLRGRDRVRSEDHTRVARMVEMGILTADQARNHPEAHILMQAIGGGPGIREAFKPGAWTEPLDIEPGDVLLLCSDGLYDLIEEHELAEIVSGRDVVAAGHRLVEVADERGGHDNITVILATVDSGMIPTLPPARPALAAHGSASQTFDPEAHAGAEPTWPGMGVEGGNSAPFHRGQASPPAPQASPGATPAVVTPKLAAAFVVAAFLIGGVVGWLAHASTVHVH